jgi:hypothetical protein
MSQELFNPDKPETVRYTDNERKVDEFTGILSKTVYDLTFAGNTCLSREIFPGERQRLADVLDALNRLNSDLSGWLKNSVKARVRINPSWLRT